jgi:hypothetical protein
VRIPIYIHASVSEEVTLAVEACGGLVRTMALQRCGQDFIETPESGFGTLMPDERMPLGNRCLVSPCRMTSSYLY